MTLICPVPAPGTQIPVGRIRIEAELSDSPRFYWQGHHDWRWFEADGLAEATARALGYRDLEDVAPTPAQAFNVLISDLGRLGIAVDQPARELILGALERVAAQ